MEQPAFRVVAHVAQRTFGDQFARVPIRHTQVSARRTRAVDPDREVVGIGVEALARSAKQAVVADEPVRIAVAALLFVVLQGMWEQGAAWAAAMIAAAVLTSKQWNPGLAWKRWRIARARARLSVLEGGAPKKPKRDEHRWLN